MRDPWNDSELARRFHASAEHSASRAPLNASLARIIGRDPALYGLLGHAPVEQQLPVLLLAAIHHLVLDEPEHRLAQWYPNLTPDHRAPDDPRLAPVVGTFVEERTPAILHLLETRRVQTNEVGRCALFLPSFAEIAADVGPIAHLDIGTSGGLNLLAPYFAYRFDDRPVVGDSPVVIACSTRGDRAPPTAIPDIVARCGIDSRPIDVTDPTEARWLEACCWPDQADRFHRLRAAIEIARHRPPEILAGDAVDALVPTVERLSHRGQPMVTTSWVMNYLPPDRRETFVDEIDRVGAELDLSWLIAESPAQTPELPHPDDLADEHVTALTLVTWRSGRRCVEHLGTCHPHGYWIHWR